MTNMLISYKALRKIVGILAMVCAGLFQVFLQDKGTTVFWAEAVMVWAFGLSWIVKGLK